MQQFREVSRKTERTRADRARLSEYFIDETTETTHTTQSCKMSGVNNIAPTHISLGWFLETAQRSAGLHSK